MPRAKRAAQRDTQRFPIDNGAVVVVEFDVTMRPKMVYLDGVVIIGEHECVLAVNKVQGLGQFSSEDGPSLDEIKEFQRRREGNLAAAKKPYTSDDAARDAGFPAGALSFETLSGIAATMGAVEESLVE